MFLAVTRGAGRVMCLRNFACHNCDKHLKKDHLLKKNFTNFRKGNGQTIID
jgi:hypothetical protein